MGFFWSVTPERWVLPTNIVAVRSVLTPCSFYDLGIAFRIAQDLGFQKDPKNWISYDASLTTDEDVEIRRRIYWGCYISDKLISLILGRPVFLYYDDAEVEPIQQQPYAHYPGH